MLDIKYIRENLDEVRKATKNKNREVDLDWLLELDGKRRKLMGEIEKLRGKRNINSKSEIRNPKQNSKLQFTIQKDEGKKLKEDIKKLEDELSTIKKEYDGLMLFVPNVPDESVPVGKDSSGNIEIRKWGPVPKRDFTPLDHIALAKKHDLIDFERGAKVAGSRSYFLKNEAALLELAVLTYTFQKLVKKGYIPLIAPSLVKEFTMIGSGQIPWSREEIYHLEKQDIYLSGTAEVPVTAYYSGEILFEKDLPKKFVAFSPCFRREAGSYGRDTKGLYRVHQFNKVEQVIIKNNDYQTSLDLHEELLANAEEVLQDLKLPYRVMLMCTGDMGEPQVKKYDIETWMPSRNSYGETMSNSFMGDFQARRLNIRYKAKDGKTYFCHTLNNTAVASPRILIAILENYQQKDGSIIIPEVLRAFVGKEVIGL
ncbi:serine--tRNA ligase [Candidatus Gottesmanbacteria bacterium CG11_big_fil_rev_8_21_14_0_20_37_11]|uniref:Serine--tRNA ligase n=3 Tax=Candidatus Gottesmaniibacteriota TaxID=1752720 RepID=A0A1J4TUP1_9BACT|nr:MAG: serine--tRNA ligase [Candidatus Gottesmanbacteria bacterium CG1_02_37_22]PIP33233.1 MAG: serine--tRNA ligase [Candidatus Gottesmanbacteria bacterium CG23_combo_of_CG06-09_8_20_14_all_37_19]PIR08432.1 MAG: serine--tRNA ligase [Candidatus Gottesmanbacteria bacterium CG11_big_fil_rev_8_21_14_0_20_37_11]